MALCNLVALLCDIWQFSSCVLVVQVLLQRLCLVLQAVLAPGGNWPRVYRDLLASPEGEYIQSRAGKRLLINMLDSLHNAGSPVKWDDNHVAVCDPQVLYTVRSLLFLALPPVSLVALLHEHLYIMCIDMHPSW